MVIEGDYNGQITELRKPKAQLFEHLFPGNKWEGLPNVNSSNTLYLLRYLLEGDSGWQEQCGKAIDEGKGFAYRISVPQADKLTLASLLTYTTSSGEKINQAAVSDLLEEGEHLGGVGSRLVIYPDDTVDVLLAMKTNQEISKQANVSAIGVLNAKGKPSAIIMYRKGDRPRGGKGMRVPQPSLAFSPVGA